MIEQKFVVWFLLGSLLCRQHEQQAMTARQQLHGLMQDIKKQEQRVKKAMDKVANEVSTLGGGG